MCALEPLANVSYITELASGYSPFLSGSTPQASSVWRWRQVGKPTPDSGAVYISRFVSYGLFRFLVYV